MTKEDKTKFFETLCLQINKLAGIDIRNKSRNTIYVEYRCLFFQMIHEIYDLKKVYKKEINQTDVMDYFTEISNRSNITHSLKMFQIYLKDSKFDLKKSYYKLQQMYKYYLPGRIVDLQNKAIYLSNELNTTLKIINYYYETKKPR